MRLRVVRALPLFIRGSGERQRLIVGFQVGGLTSSPGQLQPFASGRFRRGQL